MSTAARGTETVGALGRGWRLGLAPLRAWVDLWDRREPVSPVALVRVLVGLVLTVDLLTAWRLDLVDVLWGPASEGGLSPLTEPRPELGVFWEPTTARARIVWGVTTAGAAGVALGIATPISCLVTALGTAALGHLSPVTEIGLSYLLRSVLLVLAFSRCGASWSLDAWIRHRRGARGGTVVPAWPRYLLIAQLLWMYFAAGLAKHPARWAPWGDALAVYFALSDPVFLRWDPAWLSWGFPLTLGMTVASWTWELAAPVMLLAIGAHHVGRRRALAGRPVPAWTRVGSWFRLVYVAVGAGFHVSLLATMHLGLFPVGVLAVYPAWFHHRELAAVAQAVRHRRLAPLRVFWNG